MKIQIKRKGTNTIEIPLNAGIYANKVMAEQLLSFSFQSSKLLDLVVGDTLTYNGEEYTLNNTPSIRKTSRFSFEYDFAFEGPRHLLSKLFITHLGARKFSFSGTAQEWLNFIVDCVNSKSSGWTVGQFEDMGRVTIEFDSTYILDALTMVAEAMKGEWGVKGKVISLKKTVGTARALTFKYGKGEGLYSLTRKIIDDKKIVTRAYARGGSNNLPAGMRDYFTIDGYIEKNVSIYGLTEGEFIDEEIYPKRTGTVTAVSQINKQQFTISDSSIDFDLNGQRVDGVTPQIVFKSGLLEGNTFEIESYSPANKTIRFKANDEGNGILFPTEVVHAEVGDKYTLVGIRMPQSYIDAAVTELTAKRQEYLDSNSAPRVVYDLEIDIIQLKKSNEMLEAGDIIKVIDIDQGIDSNIRITEVNYPAHYPDVLENGMQFNAVIGNEVTYTLSQKIQNDIKKNQEVITQYNRQSWERDRRNVQALTEFRSKVFDPDGNLENAMQQAIAGWFGTESMYYDLDGVLMTSNVGGDPNAFAMSAGRLIHKVFKIEGLGNIWNLTAFSQSGLIPTQGYYLAAKCSKTALTGEWVLSTEQIPTDGVPGYWHFNFGVLSSVIDGERTFKPTKGFTLISGGSIETDVLSAYMINVNRLFAQVVTVGSDGFVNAGISGLNDRGSLSQRYWSGAIEENRYEAPFQVLDDGSLKAFKGRIGNFNINENRLSIGQEDTWQPYGKSVFLYGDYFLMRENGAVSGERRELTWNLYKGSSYAAATSIFNTTKTSDPIFPFTNIGLELEASGGDSNYSLLIRSGLLKSKGRCLEVVSLTDGDTIPVDADVILFNSGNPIIHNIYLPFYPKKGWVIEIRSLTTGLNIISNNGSVFNNQNSTPSDRITTGLPCVRIIFNGMYWYQL